MRIVELSDHPGTMLRDIRRRQRADADRARNEHRDALARHRMRVQEVRDQRDQARARRHWWAWLRHALAAWREATRAPGRLVTAIDLTREEDIVKAGMTGEQAVAAGLGSALGGDWTLLRGYRNHRGEIDHVLLGPPGLFAIEVKHRNATVHVHGDDWRYDKYDRYGNLVEQGRITDRRGRSPSVQLNEPARELERFLRGRGQPVTVRRIVVLTHPRSRLGSTKNLTIDLVAANIGAVVRQIKAVPAVLSSQQRAQVEELIVRDHHHHQARRPG